MRKILTLLFTFATITSLSQRPTINTNSSPVGDRFYFNSDLPVVISKYPEFADGTPYFLEAWTNADIILETGELYKNIKVRLDLVDNQLQYISPEGAELIASSPVKSVTLKDSVQGTEYQFVNSSFLDGAKNIDPSWYQVLASGTATLYKHISKSVSEPKVYSSSTTEPVVNTSEEYFIYADSVLSRFKKIKELPDLLKDKTKELNEYKSNKKLSGRSDSDFIELINYYNSLTQKSKAF